MKISIKTLHHFFPKYESWLDKPRDPRQQGKITYPLRDLLMSGILIFLLRLGSRRQFHHLLDGSEVIKNLKVVFNMVGRPHGDTLLCFKRLNVDEVSEIRTSMIRRLIDMRVLEKYRLLGHYYLVAVDGTGVLSFKRKHCDHCLQQKHNDKITTYSHPVLECKLVAKIGMALSMESEFIENPEGWDDSEESKQDCELKAFYRSVERLKKAFPRLSICLLLDALYAGAPVFSICKDNNWRYIITLRDNDLKSVNQEFEALSALSPNQRKKTKDSKGVVREFRWVNGIEYKTRETRCAPSFFLNVIECIETKPDGKQTRFKWITDIEATPYNVNIIANNGGRLRWKIENEGFNTQKNGGYKLEHAYCEDPVAAEVFYLLLQIACIISRLIELGSLIKKAFPKRFGSYRNIASIMLDAFRYTEITTAELKEWLSQRVRVQFDTS
jgi:hypothetical protein